ncbi:MAG: hypothetical protein ABIN01_20730 [Ferruginibacter sp.]
MKKALITIFALLYISTSMGATIHMHYCMGKISDWGLGHNESTECGNCGMKKTKKNNGCCKDEQKYIKNHTDQKVTETYFQVPEITSIELPHSRFEITRPCFITTKGQHATSHAPPLPNGLAIYIRNCIFRI